MTDTLIQEDTKIEEKTPDQCEFLNPPHQSQRGQCPNEAEWELMFDKGPLPDRQSPYVECCEPCWQALQGWIIRVGREEMLHYYGEMLSILRKRKV